MGCGRSSIYRSPSELEKLNAADPFTVAAPSGQRPKAAVRAPVAAPSGQGPKAGKADSSEPTLAASSEGFGRSEALMAKEGVHSSNFGMQGPLLDFRPPVKLHIGNLWGYFGMMTAEIDEYNAELQHRKDICEQQVTHHKQCMVEREKALQEYQAQADAAFKRLELAQKVKMHQTAEIAKVLTAGLAAFGSLCAAIFRWRDSAEDRRLYERYIDRQEGDAKEFRGLLAKLVAPALTIFTMFTKK